MSGSSREPRAPSLSTWTWQGVNAAFMMAGATVAAWTLYPVFASTAFVLVMAIAIVGGAAVVIVATRLGWGGGAAFGLGAGVYVVGALTVAMSGATSDVNSLREAVVALIRAPIVGWKDIVTLPLPLGSFGVTLMPVFALFLLGTALSTWVAVRSTRFWALGAVFLADLLITAIIVGPGVRADTYSWAPYGQYVSREFVSGLAMFVVVLAWMGWRAAYARRQALAVAQRGSHARLARTPRARMAGRAAGVVAIVAAATIIGSIVAGPFAAGTPRDVARTSVDPPLTVGSSISPLTSYRTYFEDAAYNATLFTVDVTTGAPARVRVASLSHYDGETYSASAAPGMPSVRFQRVPSTIGPAPGTTTVTADVAVRAGGGIWVPLVGELGAVTFGGPRHAQLLDSFYYLSDDVAGIVAIDGGIVVGDTYTVVGYEDDRERDLASLGTPSGVASVDPAYIPESLSTWVERQGVTRDGNGLAQLIATLRERGYLSHALDASEPGILPAWQRDLDGYAFVPSEAGHSYDRIDRLFTSLLDREDAVAAGDATSLVAAVGDDEQFAVASALMAAELGFPSRVVVGVRLEETDEQGWASPPCEATECRGQNLAAWVEVQGRDGSWVAADVTPQHTEPLAPNLTTQQDPEHPSDLDPHRAEAIVPPSSQRGSTGGEGPGTDTEGSGADWLAGAARIGGIALLSVLLLLGPLLVIAAWKAVRRRRRKRGTPRQAVHGGWDEYVDTGLEAGLPPMPVATRHELAAAYGGPHGDAVATLVDRATFSGQRLTPDDVDLLWEWVDADREAMLSERGFWDGMVMRFSLRSLWGSVAEVPSDARAAHPPRTQQWRTERTAATGGSAGSARSTRSRGKRR